MCKHEFEGHADGVTCLLCGLNLTTLEYRDFLKNGEVPSSDKVEAEEKPDKVGAEEKPVTEKPKRQNNKKKVSE